MNCSDPASMPRFRKLGSCRLLKLMSLLIRLHDGAALKTTKLAGKVWAIDCLTILTLASRPWGARINGCHLHLMWEHVFFIFGLFLHNCDLCMGSAFVSDDLVNRGLLSWTVAESHSFLSRRGLLPSE